jgi:hypothetical protein
MHYLTGQLSTPESSRILTRLCYHFSKKITVEYDEQRGLAHFLWGDCCLLAEASALKFECSAETPELLERVQYVIDEHVALFSRKAPLSVHWKEAASS